MNKIDDQWERFLDPDVIVPSLFTATMFITTFEILKNSIIDKIRNFYMNGFDDNAMVIDSEYQQKVLSKNRSVLYASLSWLQDYDAITTKDLENFETLKKVRNQLAHQLFESVTGQIESDHEAQFQILVELLRKIEVWWIVNVELPTNPDFDNQEIDENGIVPGSILSLQMLIQVASGNTELLEQWKRLNKK